MEPKFNSSLEFDFITPCYFPVLDAAYKIAIVTINREDSSVLTYGGTPRQIG